jgi:hypothetical protein
MFNKGEGGFKEQDVYPLCCRLADGKVLATPSGLELGTDIRTLKDPEGKAYGLDLYSAGRNPDGQITEVRHLVPSPGTNGLKITKVDYVTSVGELACAVGYYPSFVYTYTGKPFLPNTDCPVAAQYGLRGTIEFSSALMPNLSNAEVFPSDYNLDVGMPFTWTPISRSWCGESQITVRMSTNNKGEITGWQFGGIFNATLGCSQMLGVRSYNPPVKGFAEVITGYTPQGQCITRSPGSWSGPHSED